MANMKPSNVVSYALLSSISSIGLADEIKGGC